MYRNTGVAHHPYHRIAHRRRRRGIPSPPRKRSARLLRPRYRSSACSPSSSTPTSRSGSLTRRVYFCGREICLQTSWCSLLGRSCFSDVFLSPLTALLSVIVAWIFLYWCCAVYDGKPFGNVSFQEVIAHCAFFIWYFFFFFGLHILSTPHTVHPC